MALSLSPHQLKQVVHTPSSSNKSLPLSYSTPRQITAAVVHEKPNNETIPMSKTESALHTSSFEHGTHGGIVVKVASTSQVLPDLPSWTPLKTLGEHEGSPASDLGVDECSTIHAATNSARETTRLRVPPIATQETVENTVIAGSTPRPSSDAKPSRGKTVRFDGVVITTKPLPYRKHSFRVERKPQVVRPAPASNDPATSLVDALARTFDANRYTESPFIRRSRTGLHRHDGASTAPQTDVESTDAEDDQLLLNTRLAHSPSKRQLSRTNRIAISANASEANSEDTTPPQQDIRQPERPIKRLKAIAYESNPALIDAALGTVQAPVSWDGELDFITRDEDFVTSLVQTAPPASAGVQMTIDEGDHTPNSPRKDFQLPSTQARNEWRVSTEGKPKRSVLSPYQSRGAMFRQRLVAIFGENTTIRTDRTARPRPVELEFDFFAPLHEPDRAPSPISTDSTASVSSTSAVGEVASAIPSTHITSQSPDDPSSDITMDQLPTSQPIEEGLMTKPMFYAGEEQVNGWIAALQRLVKGKVHVKEEDLEALSTILAEIESVKDSLGRVLMTSQLRESIKQLSELHEIPFGDRNKLRQRAENIFQTWRFVMEPSAS